MLSKEEALKLVGKPYIHLKDNLAWGCLAPMYEVIPETICWRYSPKESENILEHFREHFQEISFTDEWKFGDVLIVEGKFGENHLLVCLGDGKALHNAKQTGMEIVRYFSFKDKIKGVFRYGY